MTAHGTITVDTSVDEKGLKVGIREIEESAKRATSSLEKNIGEKAKIAIQRQIDALSKLNNQYVQQAQKVDNLKQKIKELSEQKVETEGYKDLQKEMDSLYEKSAELESQLSDWAELGVPESALSFREVEKELDSVILKMEEVERQQKNMQDTGTAYINPKGTEEYQNTAGRLTVEEQRLQDMNNRLITSYASIEQKMKECSEAALEASEEIEDCGDAALEASPKAESLAKAMQKFSGKMINSGLNGVKKKIHETMRAVDNLVKKLLQISSNAVISGLKRISSGVFAIHKTANKSTFSLKRMLATSLLMAAVFRGISGAMSGVTTGFQNLAQYSQRTNTDISLLMSSLTQLKNSLATAFVPILTVIAPILSSFIDMLSRAATYVGMFFASLTGQKVFAKAVKVQENYAAGLGKTATNADKATKALKRYLSPLDEMSRYETESNSDSGENSGGDGYTAPTPGQMFEEVPIEDKIKKLADKIKKFIKTEDWEGLGKFLADEINKGMAHVYDAISWKKVGPKITKFVRAFTRTFNSLVKYLDFDLLGRTIGAGINTAIRTANLLIGNGGIDFKQLGSKIAQGLKGAIREISWTELGNLLGNYFMISWHLLNGFVTDMSKKNDAGLTGWAELGKALGKAINGLFDKVDFSEIAITLTTGLNGTFESLENFTKTVKWDDLEKNVTDGLNTAFSNMKWEDAGKSLNDFIGDLVGFLVGILKNTNWEEFGEGLGTMLSEIDWGKYLWDMIIAIKDAIGGLFDGLEKGGTAGKIAAFLGKAFLAVKIAQITGLDSLVKLLIGAIGKKLFTAENISSIASSLRNLFSGGSKEAGELLGELGEAASGSGSKFGTLAKELAPLVGEAGLIVGVGAAAVYATSKIAGMVESMQGGNGVGTTFGNTMDNFIQTLQQRGDIISGSATEIWNLKESLEKEGMTADEKASATQKLVDKLGEMGVTSEQATLAFETLRQKGLITDDMFNVLSESIKTLGNDTTNMAGQINLGSQKAQESYDDLKVAIGNLTNQMHLGTDEQGQLLNALDRTVDSGGTAQDAYNNVMAAVKAMGGNTETAAKIFAEVFPNAVQATKTSVDTSMTGAQQTVTSTTSKMKTDAEANLAGVQKAAEDAAGSVNTSTVKNWGNSASEVDKNLDQMKQHANLKLGEMQKTVDSHFSSQYNTMTKKWEKAGERVSQIISNMETSTSRQLSKLESLMQSAGTRMGNNLANGISGAVTGISNTFNEIIRRVNSTISNINGAVGGIERSFTFNYNYTNPITKTTGRYSSWLSLPRVNSVPYLASGAVIPPRSEFLAVLGDQKNGNNIEAPETLIRKIFREESPQVKGGNTYNISAQAKGKTIFELVLEEGKLSQDRTGRNPFWLT